MRGERAAPVVTDEHHLAPKGCVAALGGVHNAEAVRPGELRWIAETGPPPGVTQSSHLSHVQQQGVTRLSHLQQQGVMTV